MGFSVYSATMTDPKKPATSVITVDQTDQPSNSELPPAMRTFAVFVGNSYENMMGHWLDVAEYQGLSEQEISVVLGSRVTATAAQFAVVDGLTRENFLEIMAASYDAASDEYAQRIAEEAQEAQGPARKEPN